MVPGVVEGHSPFRNAVAGLTLGSAHTKGQQAMLSPPVPTLLISGKPGGTYQNLPVPPALPAGYPYPGFPFPPLVGFPTSPGPFLGPWTVLPNPHAAAAAAAAAAVAAAAAAVAAESKNSHPSQ